MNELWAQLAARANRTIDEAMATRLSDYLDLLLAANETMNLTRIDSREEAERLHVADALTLLPYLLPGKFSLADIGSGGGIPGIILAIVRPEGRIVLIESTQKKARFLEETIAKLELPNVTVIADRAENVKQRFDTVVTRAVGSADKVVQWSLPLVRTGGKMLAMKGPKLAIEMPVAVPFMRRLFGANPVIHPVELEGTTGRVILEITKR